MDEIRSSEHENNDNADAQAQEAEVAYNSWNETGVQRQEQQARRRFLRRSMLAFGGLAATAGVAGALRMLYPELNAHFGDWLDVGSRADFPAALPTELKLDHAGVFYQNVARAFIVHLDRRTPFLVAGNLLQQRLEDEWFVRDDDGSYWLALYQRCVHLGTTVDFLDKCQSFKCPSHGAHYNCDGAYLDGPAPRDMDRFQLSIQNGHILIDTSRIARVNRSNQADHIIAMPDGPCLAY